MLAHLPRSAPTQVIDDLRPDLEVYGQAFTYNPNIRALGESSGAVVFDNAYCSIAVCSPS